MRSNVVPALVSSSKRLIIRPEHFTMVKVPDYNHTVFPFALRWLLFIHNLLQNAPIQHLVVAVYPQPVDCFCNGCVRVDAKQGPNYLEPCKLGNVRANRWLSSDDKLRCCLFSTLGQTVCDLMLNRCKVSIISNLASVPFKSDLASIAGRHHRWQGGASARMVTVNSSTGTR